MKTVLPWTLQTRSPILLILLCRLHNRNSSFHRKGGWFHAMSKRKQRHMSPAGFLLALVLLIVGIFALDAFYRVFLQNVPENIVGVGGFASTPSASDTSSAGEENADTTEATQPSGTVLQLTAADEANGSLILVDAAHPYAGAQAWTDFSAVTDTNVKPRDTSCKCSRKSRSHCAVCSMHTPLQTAMPIYRFTARWTPR